MTLDRMSVDPNIRRGGHRLVVTAKTANKVQFFDAASLQQIASIAARKGPMGFGFAPDGHHAYLCCHDDAVVLEFALATGRVTRQFETAPGCEYVIAYHDR